MPDRVLNPPRPDITGRRAERRLIEEALGRVATEGGAAVLISGETGVGKTALGRDALGQAENRGFLALEGGSNPLTREIAYSPLVQALGTGLRIFEASERDRLVTDLPALGALFVDLGLPAPEPLGDAALERTRLFEAVLRLLDRISRRAPVAILLDDLQWFDHASMELLAYISRDLSGLPVLLLGTYRPEDDQVMRLRNLLQSLRRTQVAVEVELAALTRDEIGELTRRTLGDDVSESVIELLATRSAGVPLFAEAMVSTWRDQGVLRESGGVWVMVPDSEPAAPPVARDVIRERLERLPDRERRLIDFVAVGGGRVTWKVLREVTDLAGESSLAQLMQTGVLVETVGNDLTYEFAHPLMLEVAYEDVPGPTRRRLHARFAEVWEKVAPDDVGTLAVHYRGALPEIDASRVVEVSVAAGRKSLELYANQEALAHLTAALELGATGQNSAEILTLCGEAKLRVGYIDGAVETWRAAIDEIGDDSRLTAKLHLLIARALIEVLSEEWDHHVQAALTALEDDDASDEKMELLYLAVIHAHRRGDAPNSQQAAERVALAAEQSGSARARALALAAQTIALLDSLQFDKAAALLAANRSLFGRQGGAELEMRGHVLSATIAAARGDLATLKEENRNALSLVRRSGLPSAGFRVQLGQFVEAFYEGDWERAREVVAEARVMSEAVGFWPSLMLAGLLSAILHAFKAEFEEADALISAPEMRSPVGLTPTLAAIAQAIIAIEQDDPDGALSVLGESKTTWATSTIPPWRPVVEAEALAQAGRGEAALEVVRKLAKLGGEGSYPEAMSCRLKGLALGALDEQERAADCLKMAAAGFARLGMPFEAARACVEQAEATLRYGESDDVLASSLERWYGVLVDLGARRYVDRARRLLNAMGRPAPAADREHDLTPRQLEVAELVAQGLSNAEIAEAMFISVRTVESHLDHIYTRLGFNSRVSLATYVKAHLETAST